MQKTIYIDMDGVLADFNRKAQEILGATEQDNQSAAQAGRWPPEQWRRLTQDSYFYRHLPKTAQADQIMAWAQRFEQELGWRLRVLTAVPKDNDMPEAFHDKILWIQDHYPGTRVWFGPYSRDKKLHCKAGDLLVDDRADNCRDWQAAGGRVIRARDLDQAVWELEQEFKQAQADYQTMG